MRTVHFEPTISAAPATEQVGALAREASCGWPRSDCTAAASGRLARGVEGGHDRLRDPSAELLVRDACDLVEEGLAAVGGEHRTGEKVAKRSRIPVVSHVCAH